VAGCCAFGARRSWHVGILWFEGKSGHLERGGRIGSSQEVLRWLLAVQLNCRKIAETGKSTGSCRLLALPSQNRNTLCGPPYRPAMPGFPPSDALSVKKCLGVNAAPLVQRNPPQLQGPDTVDPALSYRNMPIRSRYPTSLCTTIGRSQYHLSIVGEAVKS
jgi:hypothetical protein